jgi:5-methylcytosine-specific restriction protein B
MEKVVKIYNINSSLASENLKQLYYNTFLYWDIKSFENDEVGSEVFFIWRQGKKIIYCKLVDRNLDSNYDREKNLTEFTDGDQSYQATGAWGKFVKFDVIDEAPISADWNFTAKLGEQNPVCNLYREGSKLDKVEMRLKKISDLKNVDFKQSETQQRLSEIEELLEKKPVAIKKEALETKRVLERKRFSIIKAKEDITNSGLKISDRTLSRFVASLLTKPFVILTGLSGSGKTKLAQAFATWICENEDQYFIVPVGADWTNREPLLGFPNALKSGEYVKPDNRVLDLIIEALGNADKPYFLILDEMNLSHVERYFADFLSVMESHGKILLHGGSKSWDNVPSEINLPRNLFIIGTVNIDETTYMFSPKVLDRASVIEFRVTAKEMKSFLSDSKTVDLKSLRSGGATMAKSFVEIAIDKNLEIDKPEELTKALLDFFNELKKTGAEFGYRSASEILRFAAVINEIESSWTLFEIIDAGIMQKLLPKVHGSRRKLEPVLKTLAVLCSEDSQNIDDLISSKTEIDFDDRTKIKYPISLEKILRMYQNLIGNGFTSYAEA